ncbi:hypothetical protein B0T18DRAFT_223376 [Schizothecium vesticola]|uniref:Uncharacterized protein n=1 Tax=Schizothecium vesticola TaxID=314040 RepID=A0AA40EKJ9_9PEZI|nr:hypothetical protein B0T18DRAFT_223376 [Schizothecium vesticola]
MTSGSWVQCICICCISSFSVVRRHTGRRITTLSGRLGERAGPLLGGEGRGRGLHHVLASAMQLEIAQRRGGAWEHPAAPGLEPQGWTSRAGGFFTVWWLVAGGWWLGTILTGRVKIHSEVKLETSSTKVPTCAPTICIVSAASQVLNRIEEERDRRCRSDGATGIDCPLPASGAD